jgi:hypothetical protein
MILVSNNRSFINMCINVGVTDSYSSAKGEQKDRYIWYLINKRMEYTVS